MYTAVLKKVHDQLPDLASTQVIADFEETATATVHVVFRGNVLLSRCWFYYSQAVIKCVRKIGRTDAYKDEEEVHNVIASAYCWRRSARFCKHQELK